MVSHSSLAVLAPFLPRYPKLAGALFQTYNDLSLAQHWTDVEVVDLVKSCTPALKGRRPKSDDILYVIPCALSDSLSVSWLKDVLDELDAPEQIFLAINTEDSSIVYYKISPGIVKPPV